MQIDIQTEDPRWHDRIKSAQSNIEKIILGALDYLAADTRNLEISITLTNDEDIQRLNKNWRGKDSPTNVLSFPQDSDTPSPFSSHLGDIVLAFETIEREALEQNKKPEDHFTHLLVHGTLHLMGYDHEDDRQAEEMEQLEIDILSKMGLNNPYE